METVLEDWVFWKLFAHNVFYFQKREAFPPIVVSVCLAVLNVKNTVQNDVKLCCGRMRQLDFANSCQDLDQDRT